MPDRKLARSAGWFLAGLILSSPVRAGNNLDSLRQNIRNLESNLKDKTVREKTLLNQVEDLDRQIGLRATLIQELEEQKKGKERDVRDAETELARILEGHARLSEHVSRRMVSMYKRGRYSDWEILFSMSSVNQVMVWIKYQKRIIEADRRNLRLLAEKNIEVQNQKQVLEREMEAKARLIETTREEKAESEKAQTERKKLLVQVRKDKKAVEERLRQMRLAYQQIKTRIVEEEKKRGKAEKTTVSTRFAGLKGNLMWPVRGKVVSHYGRQKDPVLKTWTENLGIDIRTAERDTVRAVHKGKVAWVDWQRGMGNLVVEDHGDGFYTVYGYLDAVWVEAGQALEAGEPIGRVGDKNSLNGSMLNFQVWNTVNHVDPETWLR
jgi:septal ring factor EnvC (AmiA/AmiB activator)